MKIEIELRLVDDNGEVTDKRVSDFSGILPTPRMVSDWYYQARAELLTDEANEQ